MNKIIRTKGEYTVPHGKLLSSAMNRVLAPPNMLLA